MYVSIDIGGTNIRILAVENLEQIDFAKTIRLKNTNNYKVDFQSIVDFIEARKAKTIHGIVIGFAGDISADGKTVTSSNITDWENKEFVKELEEKFQSKVFLKNDVELNAIGDFYLNSYDFTKYVFISWGTGIGACKVRKLDDKDIAIDVIDWDKHLEDFESLLGGRNAETRFGKKLEFLDSEGWKLLSLDLKSLINYLSESFEVNSFIISGGISQKRHKDLESVFNNDSNSKILLSNIGEEGVLIGGFEFLKRNL